MNCVTFVNILAAGCNIARIVSPSFVTNTERFNTVCFAISVRSTFHIFTWCLTSNAWWSSNETTLINTKIKKWLKNSFKKLFLFYFTMKSRTYLGHSHRYDPGVFIHIDRSPQMLIFVRHSSISTHTDPCGSKPFWQKHCPSIHSAFVVQSKLLWHKIFTSTCSHAIFGSGRAA